VPGFVLVRGREVGGKEFEKSRGVSWVFSGCHICHAVEAATDMCGCNGCGFHETEADGEGSEEAGSSRAGRS
jgi:hypothetical protein